MKKLNYQSVVFHLDDYVFLLDLLQENKRKAIEYNFHERMSNEEYIKVRDFMNDLESRLSKVIEVMSEPKRGGVMFVNPNFKKYGK